MRFDVRRAQTSGPHMPRKFPFFWVLGLQLVSGFWWSANIFGFVLCCSFVPLPPSVHIQTANNDPQHGQGHLKAKHFAVKNQISRAFVTNPDVPWLLYTESLRGSPLSQACGPLRYMTEWHFQPEIQWIHTILFVTIYKTELLHKNTHSPFSTLDTSSLIRTFFCRLRLNFFLINVLQDSNFFWL